MNDDYEDGIEYLPDPHTKQLQIKYEYAWKIALAAFLAFGGITGALIVYTLVRGIWQYDTILAFAVAIGLTGAGLIYGVAITYMAWFWDTGTPPQTAVPVPKPPSPKSGSNGRHLPTQEQKPEWITDNVLRPVRQAMEEGRDSISPSVLRDEFNMDPDIGKELVHWLYREGGLEYQGERRPYLFTGKLAEIVY